MYLTSASSLVTLLCVLDVSLQLPDVFALDAGPGCEEEEDSAALEVSLLQRRTDTQRTQIQTLSPQTRSSSRLPSIFVAIFTRRSGSDRRTLIREMYSRARTGDGGVVARFVVCHDADGLQENLEAESRTHGDLLFLECEEGYANGLLTKKTVASMKAHVDLYADLDLFMKVDDDTFISWSRLDRHFEVEGWEDSYSGILYPNCSPVERDPESAFYEPPETWRKDTFPASMAGGPGYLLDTKLVYQILNRSLPEAYPLWNEDKAVGVWLDALRVDGVRVNYVNISGSDGYAHPNLPYICGGLWGDYPYVLHHDLSGEAIACLSRADAAGDAFRDVTPCFELNDEDCNPSTDTGSTGVSKMQKAISYAEKMQIYWECANTMAEENAQMSALSKS